jgi:hydroxyethylthiazole kinase-like uncharacterized protein yjeF
MNDLIPILNAGQVRQLEQTVMGGDPAREWPVIERAGAGIGQSILNDFNELRPLPRDPRALVLLGKGHNAADALAAAREILLARPRGTLVILPLWGRSAFRPLTEKLAASLSELKAGTIEWLDPYPFWNEPESTLRSLGQFDMMLDGILGLSARLPLETGLQDLIRILNLWDGASFRAGIDIPTGLGEGEGETQILRADFTYAAGTMKECLLRPESQAAVGRIRFIDLGFPLTEQKKFEESTVRWVTEPILAPLRRLRPSLSDKRSYGHVFMVGGSRLYPGAILLAAKAALRAGAGLVSVGAPESLVPAFAAACPEAIWIPLPQTPEGGVSAAAADRFKALYARADCLLIGPGMGPSEGALACAANLAASFNGPLILDADALRLSVVQSAKDRPSAYRGTILTPHEGEFLRLAQSPKEAGADSRPLAERFQAIVVRKGPITRICDSHRVFLSGFGGPLLARGGSGDLLAGMIAALVGRASAQNERDLLPVVARAQAWHGLAADALARSSGQEAVTTSALLPYLSTALRE